MINITLCGKIGGKYKGTKLLTLILIHYLVPQIKTNMNHLILGAFYDNVTKNVGPTLMWVFTLLLTVELLYVMAKYLGSEDKK